MKLVKKLQWSTLFSLICTFLFLPPLNVNGQSSRTIKAVGTITTTEGISIPFTMEFIPFGGQVTGKIDFKSEVPWRNSDTGTCPSTMNLTMNGTFAGGDGGAAHGDLLGEENTLCGPTSWQGEWGGGARVVYGKDAILAYGKTDWSGNFYANGTGSGKLHFWYRIVDFRVGPVEATWKITFSPDEFQGESTNPAATEPPAETTEAAGPVCRPTVRGLDNLKSGDVISPGASYFDDGGKEVGIIQERWYINGKETSSATWNGERTVIELQYTCLDHKGRSITMEIPAYQQPPPGQPPADQAPIQQQPPGQPPSNQPGSSSLLTTVIGLGILGAGALGLTGLGAFWITKILRGGSAPKAAVPRPVKPSPMRLPHSPVGHTPIPHQPPPQTQKTPTNKKSGEVEKKDIKSDDGEKKGGLDAAKEAAENYGKGLESIADPLNKIKEQLGKDKVLPPDVKEKMTKYINSLTEPIEKVKERAEGWSKEIGKYTDLRDKVKEATNELDKNIQEIAKTHQKALKDLKNLPPGAANAAADLSAALDALGRGADSAFNKIPGYKDLGGEKTFEVSKSFQEAGKGLQKAIKTIKTSESEAMDLSKDGDALPGYTPKTIDPEIERIRREAEKYRWKSQSTWEWWKEQIQGKPVDEKTKAFR